MSRPYHLDGTFVFPVILIVAYLTACVLSLVNYGVFFSKNVNLVGRSVADAHIAFCIIGTVCFFALSSVLWLRSAKYATASYTRIAGLVQGLWIMFLFKDLPLFSVEATTIVNVGWVTGYQGFCFVVQLIFFLLSLIFSWLSFAWAASGLIHKRFSDNASATVLPSFTKESEHSGNPALRAYLSTNSSNQQPLILPRPTSVAGSEPNSFDRRPTADAFRSGLPVTYVPPPPLPLQSPSIGERTLASSQRPLQRSSSSGREFRWDSPPQIQEQLPDYEKAMARRSYGSQYV